MTSVVAEIKTVVSTLKTAKWLAENINASSAVKDRLEALAVEVDREIGQVSYAVCKALVAHALGRDPFHEEVNTFMAVAVADPAFSHRAYRLIGEAKKSASSRRRRFLASVLFGLPFARLPDDERDRVDMVVERMIPADLDLLDQIEKKFRSAPEPESDAERSNIFRDSKVVVLARRQELYLASRDDFETLVLHSERLLPGHPPVDSSAFASLRFLGCIETSESRSSIPGNIGVSGVFVTAIGDSLLQVIRDLRCGYETET